MFLLISSSISQRSATSNQRSVTPSFHLPPLQERGAGGGNQRSVISDEELKKDRNTTNILRYHVIRALAGSGNVCLHLAAKALKRAPSSYGNCFEILGKDS